MSELKAFVARKIDEGTCDPVPCVEVYPKSETDKVLADKDTEIRRLRRALFKACANWAYATENLAANFLDVYEAKKWAAVYARCIKKAGESK